MAKERIRQGELKKPLSSLGNLSPEQRKGLESLTISITKKILNDPRVFLKRKEDKASRTLYLDITRRLFHLDPTNDDKNPKRGKQDGKGD
ncbi:MAG: hypothetical protein JSW35_00735 [Deltaproteobacteria bacterium]|nr:MAG: hypothetical protein JSW35_00735 [Deltaproteobacteria bacterium]